MNDLFREFRASDDTLWVFAEGQLVFKSNQDGLRPLLDYLAHYYHQAEAIIFDRVMGNAAALLAIKAGCSKVYSPLGTELARRRLTAAGVACYFVEIVPYISARNGQGMCPMEKLSIDKSPDEFYAMMIQPATACGQARQAAPAPKHI